MAIEYDPKIWVSKEIITAADMSRLEQGIADSGENINDILQKILEIMQTYALKTELVQRILIDSANYDVSTIQFAYDLDFCMVETAPDVTFEWFGITTEGHGLLWRYADKSKYLMIVYTEEFQIGGANWNADTPTAPYVKNVINLTDTVTQSDLAAVQEQVTEVLTALEQHKVSGDHDDRYYTKDEVDNKIQEIVQSLVWHPSVPTFADLATTYPEPLAGWAVAVDDENTVYRYSGTEWEPLFKVLLNIVTEDNDGLMTSEMLAQLVKATADILTKAPINHASNTTEYGISSAALYGHTRDYDGIDGANFGAGSGRHATPKAVYNSLQEAMAYTLQRINALTDINYAKQLTDAVTLTEDFDPLTDVTWKGSCGIVPVRSNSGVFVPWSNSAAGFLIKHTDFVCTVWVSRSSVENNNSDYAYRKFYYNSTTGTREWGDWQTELTKEMADLLYPPMMHTSPIGQTNPYGTGSGIVQGHVALNSATNSAAGADQGQAATPLAVRNGKQEAIEESKAYTDSLAHTHVVELDTDGNLVYPSSITDMEVGRVDVILFPQDALIKLQNYVNFIITSAGDGSIERISAIEWRVRVSYWYTLASSTDTKLPAALACNLTMQEDESIIASDIDFEGIARMYHATANTTYGAASNTLYGHVKTSESIDSVATNTVPTSNALRSAKLAAIVSSNQYTDEKIAEIKPGGGSSGVYVNDPQWNADDSGLNTGEMCPIVFGEDFLNTIVGYPEGGSYHQYSGVLYKETDRYYRTEGVVILYSAGYQTETLGFYYNAPGNWAVYKSAASETIVVDTIGFPKLSDYAYNKTYTVTFTPYAILALFGGSGNTPAIGSLYMQSNDFARCNVIYRGYGDQSVFISTFYVNKETGEIINTETTPTLTGQLVDTISAEQLFAPRFHTSEHNEYGAASEMFAGHVKMLSYIDSSEDNQQDHGSAVSASAVIAYVQENINQIQALTQSVEITSTFNPFENMEWVYSNVPQFKLVHTAGQNDGGFSPWDEPAWGYVEKSQTVGNYYTYKVVLFRTGEFNDVAERTNHYNTNPFGGVWTEWKFSTDSLTVDTANGLYAPINHASTASTYGRGNGTTNGHLRISNATDLNSGTNDGIAATPLAVMNGKAEAIIQAGTNADTKITAALNTVSETYATKEETENIETQIGQIKSDITDAISTANNYTDAAKVDAITQSNDFSQSIVNAQKCKYGRLQRNGISAPFSFSTSGNLSLEINAATYTLETYNNIVQTVGVAAQSVEWVEDAKLIINVSTGVIVTGTYADAMGDDEAYIIGTCVWARGGTVQAVYIDGFDLVENIPSTINQSVCYMLSWGVTTPLVDNADGTWTLAAGTYRVVDMSTAQQYSVTSTGVAISFEFSEVLCFVEGTSDILVRSSGSLPDGAKIIGAMNRQEGTDVVMINGMKPLTVTSTTE